MSDKTRCTEMVSGRDSWGRRWQCPYPAKYGDKCGTHDPTKIAERAKRRPPTQFQRRITQRHEEERATAARRASHSRLLDGLLLIRDQSECRADVAIAADAIKEAKDLIGE